MNDKLNPCPFCGELEDLVIVEGAIINEGDSREDLFWRRYVECQNCGAIGPYADNRREARKAWNERKEAKHGD
jgi:Lar family restriction alleviation protein